MSPFGDPRRLPPPHPPLQGGAAPANPATRGGGPAPQPPSGPPVWRGAHAPPPPRPPARPPAPGGTPSQPPSRGGGARLSVVRGTRPRATITELTPLLHRIAVHRGKRGLWFRCVALASAIACLVFMLAFLLEPAGEQLVIQILPPPNMVTVIPEPEITRPSESVLEELTAIDKVDVSRDLAPEQPKPGERYRPELKLPADAGKAGRERAREATSKLAEATASLDQTLGQLSTSLRTPSGTGRPLPRGRRPRTMGSGRSGGQIGAVETGSVGSGASADLGHSSVEGARLAIGALRAGGAGGGAAAGGATSTDGAAPGVYRTNASLLAVIQKYAAGIQWCYENELKRDPNLRGKLVVSITVSAAGRVTAAGVIENTVDSQRLSVCALSQVRDWRFPPVPEGATAFQAPFVFTPPN